MIPQLQSIQRPFTTKPLLTFAFCRALSVDGAFPRLFVRSPNVSLRGAFMGKRITVDLIAEQNPPGDKPGGLNVGYSSSVVTT